MIHLPVPSLDGLMSERLLFRRLRTEDIDWWMGYMNNAEAIRFMPFSLGSRADGLLMIQRSLDRYAQDGSGLHAIVSRTSNEPLGQCGLLTQDVDGEQELEIGYHLLPAQWGQGYATEAAVAVRRFAEQHQIAPTLISLIDAENHRSQAVALRNGMQRTGSTIHRGTPALIFRTAHPATS